MQWNHTCSKLGWQCLLQLQCSFQQDSLVCKLNLVLCPKPAGRPRCASLVAPALATVMQLARCIGCLRREAVRLQSELHSTVCIQCASLLWFVESTLFRNYRDLLGNAFRQPRRPTCWTLDTVYASHRHSAAWVYVFQLCFVL